MDSSYLGLEIYHIQDITGNIQIFFFPVGFYPRPGAQMHILSYGLWIHRNLPRDIPHLEIELTSTRLLY